MRIVLPKASRGYHFPRLFSVEMNDFDVERLLPSLFYLTITKGRGRGPRKNDPKDFERYLDSLAQHSRLEGFDDSVGKRLLSRWIRSAVVEIGRSGRGKREEQIEYALPITLLCYKTGFPAEIRRQRNVHVFMYQLLCDVLQQGEGVTGSANLNQLFRQSFGKGVVVDNLPNVNGRYDGTTEVDIHTFLSLCYLDGFEATTVAKREVTTSFAPVLPLVASNLGHDIVRYLLAYKERMPPLALMRGLMTLVNFELFIYTVKLLHGTNCLTQDEEIPRSMTDHLVQSTPEIYVDLTRERGSTSDELARACVDRDLEEIRVYFESVMILRTIDRFMAFLPRVAERLKHLSAPEYLLGLFRLRGDADIQASARQELALIRHETMEACQNEDEKREADEFFNRLVSESDAVKATAALLANVQRKKAVESYVLWYWSVGGLRKRYGILSGNIRGRRNWRYAMSDDLLVTLVQLAMIEDPSGDLEHVTPRASLRLVEFLEFLEERFGVLIARPPRFLDSVTARAAAGDNFEALKRRLRQMGFFQALSDDFTAQKLQMPEVERVTT